MPNFLWEALLGYQSIVEDGLYQSIQNHLQQLLNARQGSLPHLPDYGLPDLTAIFQGLPYSQGKLIYAIQHTIERYEPRLQQICIISHLLSPADPILRVEIQAVLPNMQAIGYDTFFLSTGYALIEPMAL